MQLECMVSEELTKETLKSGNLLQKISPVPHIPSAMKKVHANLRVNLTS